jgi:hypothetical protein
MRKLIVAALLITLLVVVGWLSFRFDGRQASVNLDTQEIREDTKELIDKGEAAVSTATQRGRELIDDSTPAANKP